MTSTVIWFHQSFVTNPPNILFCKIFEIRSIVVVEYEGKDCGTERDGVGKGSPL